MNKPTSRRILMIMVMVATALVLSACLSTPDPQPTTTPGSTAVTGTSPQQCHYRISNGQTLPDPTCTPGKTNPQVTQATIHQTICVSGWTATIRPSSSTTGPMKTQSEQQYGASGVGEYDHLISLELGGAPLDKTNLWFEPGKIPNPKDQVENRLNAAVCSGRITLDMAQRSIATDWTTAVKQTGA